MKVAPWRYREAGTPFACKAVAKRISATAIAADSSREIVAVEPGASGGIFVLPTVMLLNHCQGAAGQGREFFLPLCFLQSAERTTIYEKGLQTVVYLISDKI